MKHHNIIVRFCMHPIWHYSPRTILRLVKKDWEQEKKGSLLDWAETLLCNATPMSHCTQEDWDKAVREWRDQKHAK